MMKNNVRIAKELVRIARNLIALDKKEWCDDRMREFRKIPVPNGFEKPAFQHSSASDFERIAAIFKYGGELPSEWRDFEKVALVAVEAILQDGVEKWQYQVSAFAGPKHFTPGMLFGCEDFEKTKEWIETLAGRIRDLIENDDDGDEEPTKEELPKNGGWGEYKMSWSGGSIRPNLEKLNENGYALEFAFDTYLEYDQHWPLGWNEQKIVQKLKTMANLDEKKGDYYYFTAKDEKEISRILEFANSLQLEIDTPE